MHIGSSQGPVHPAHSNSDAVIFAPLSFNRSLGVAGGIPTKPQRRKEHRDLLAHASPWPDRGRLIPSPIFQLISVMRTILCFLLATAFWMSGPAAESPKTKQPARPRTSSTSGPAALDLHLEDFKLIGDLSGERASFTLTATAIVESPKGGALDLLEGAAALTEVASHPRWELRAESNRFVAIFDHAGKFPIQIKFDAAVHEHDTWKTVDFRLAPSALQPLLLKGLAEDTKFEFAGARPERKGSDFVTWLPPDGSVRLSWQQARTEAEGKLFYSGEMLSQISVSPGLMRQVALLNFKVMQGELSRVTLLLSGAGEVTRVQGEQVLAWNVEPGTNSEELRLVVQLNQPQKDRFSFQVQAQTPLGAFPQSADVARILPEGATRFAGYFRIVNEGAVRLEVTRATGLSQISPEQFPESDATKTALRLTGNQRFAYRFSGTDFAIRIQADQVLPELSISQALAYRLGENEQTIDSEIELEIREAPLRELLLRIPKSYAIARLNASGLSDYFVHELDDQSESELRLVYGQPISGRQLVELRLERNKALGETTWNLPRIDVPKAKSVRGHVGVSADAGFRLTAERTQGLTEIATAFFPRKLSGIQAAFRVSEASWQAALRVERLPQTVQVDGFHLFSIGEGIAYGSSLMNYVVSGSPVAAFRVELSGEYYNVEFTGKDIRNWQKIDGGYLVQLHTPVSGSYPLLATYERPFKSQGETLTFTGARPLDAQSEQGHTVIISAYQFDVKPQDVSSGLLRLETREVPAEYRLFFDAPILAAYRYTARPFNLKLALTPLAQGDSISQVVDRASLTNRISKEGQVLTEVRYFVKNRGNPYFRVTLPPGTDLWSATVNGATVVPVVDGLSDNLIPLPQHADCNTVLALDLKLASRSKNPRHVTIEAPKLNAPILLTDWTLEPDAKQRLVYQHGSLTPIGGVPDASGFAAIGRLLSGDQAAHAAVLLIAALFLVAAALVLWRWSSQEGVFKFSSRHLLGGVLGLIAFAIAVGMFWSLGGLLADETGTLPRNVAMVAPVQQPATQLNVEVANISEKASVTEFLGHAWPAIVGVLLWIYGSVTARPWFKRFGWLVVWALLAWAALRCSNGAPVFVAIIVLYLLFHAVVPLLLRARQLPRRPSPETEPEGGTATATATVLFLLGLAWLNSGCAGLGQSGRAAVATNEIAVADSVFQDIRVEDKFAVSTLKVHSSAAKGQRLPLVFEPAVLTQLSFPSNSLRLAQSRPGSKRVQELVAEREGAFDISARYEIRVAKRDHEHGFNLPVQYALVNKLKLVVVDNDVEISSPQAVSVQRDTSGSNTVSTLVLAPAPEAWIGWKPRSRDVRKEKSVFYAEVSQLYAPSAGVIEGAHLVSIRPAQGELAELVLEVPAGATVTDVYDPARATDDKSGAPRAAVVSLWRFDPDTRKLRVKLNPAQSRPFAIVVRTQVASGPLPFEQSVGLVSVEGAAGQIGMLGLATGNEVQLDSVNAADFSPINLEDFPADAVAPLQGQIAGLTVRRAYRYSENKGLASIKASAVEPDIRVETQDTLSLGEDRTVLAANASVAITRAGIFRLSFVMPSGFDVEAISGSALSHWTELKTDEGRIITLHLTGKTEGQQQFAISLAGPGLKARKGWSVPQLSFREANKQRGTLLIVPEQGMRLQAADRDGLTQLDPQRSGIKQKGVLAFRVLQTPWRLALDVEQVDPWIQVTSLQHVTINDAQIKVAANLQYQIENTGLKAFRIRVPTNAEGVRFQGDQVSDFLPIEGAITNGLQEWEVKLHRRIIGPYLLQATYQTALPENASEILLRGVQTADVNLQRGFVTIQSAGRLQLQITTLPEALQPTEWQSIPRALQHDLQAALANAAYRLVDPSFQLPIKLARHEAAKLKPARVNNITFTSVISDDGVALTRVRLEMLPGDKRLLKLTLPKKGDFWFAFVNQNGVWPWREQDKIDIPLEQQSPTGKPTLVEVFYSSSVGSANARALDLEVLAPKFDLPLENITWRVSLGDKWKVKHSTGSLQLEGESENAALASAADVQTYLSTESTLQRERTKEAEAFMAAGNAALQAGEPQQARRSFQAAYGLSAHDAAFNEDARVQLHNIKLQQALVGLNVRQATSTGDANSLAGKLRDLRARKELNYSQQDAKDIIDRNTADENSAYMRLAERLVQQQDAAVSSPAAIRASIPEQGRVLTFKRSVAVDDWADLRIGLEATAIRPAPMTARFFTLLITVAVLALFALLARKTSANDRSQTK